jgi:CheY-like chemotaxis protein
MTRRTAPAHSLVRYASRSLELEAVLTEIGDGTAVVSAPRVDPPGTHAALTFRSYLAWEEIQFGCRVVALERGGMRLDLVDMGAAGRAWLGAYLGSFVERPRVLMIDDDPFMLRIMQKFLEAQGIELVGVQIPILPADVERFTPSLVLLDFMMSSMDAVGLARQLVRAGVPLAFYSASPPEQLGEELAAVPCFSKVVRPRELVPRLAELLRSFSGGATATASSS